MEVYVTEEQQVEALRKWFKEKGVRVFASAIIILFLILGFQYWRHHQAVTLETASETYQLMMIALEKQDFPTAKSKANGLIKDYERTPYATLAKLLLAKLAVESNKMDEAKANLQWVITNSKIVDFQDIARIRLAKILFSQHKAEEALGLLKQDASSYAALLQELKGDILLSKNKSQEAHAIYKAAYQAMLKEEIHNPLLKMKLEELGEV